MSKMEMSYEEIAVYCTSTVMIHVFDKEGNKVSFGSGVVVSNDGLIATNLHVVEGGYLFKIQFEDERVFITYMVIAGDKRTDLALLKIDALTEPIPICLENNVRRGQKVVALGSPLELLNTISDGIVSGLRKFANSALIQTTTPVSNGSSGGALLNMYGELIGIISSSFSCGQNLNMAVPSSFLMELINEKIYKVNTELLKKYRTITIEGVISYQVDVFFEYVVDKPYHFMLYFKSVDHPELAHLKDNRELQRSIEQFCSEELVNFPQKYGIYSFEFGIGSQSYGLSVSCENKKIADWKWIKL